MPTPSSRKATAVAVMKPRTSLSTGLRSSAAMKITGVARFGSLAWVAIARSGSSSGPLVAYETGRPGSAFSWATMSSGAFNSLSHSDLERTRTCSLPSLAGSAICQYLPEKARSARRSVRAGAITSPLSAMVVPAVRLSMSSKRPWSNRRIAACWNSMASTIAETSSTARLQPAARITSRRTSEGWRKASMLTAWPPRFPVPRPGRSGDSRGRARSRSGQSRSSCGLGR
ncbi:MAG: hypothetical protein K0Q62_1973 [Phenylobacterium sp.]|nr:hypothetical protein [Phenylobacterium sp.]